MSLPEAAARAKVEAAIAEVISALENHPLWTARPHAMLYQVWDFLNRSKYMCSECENIRDGNALKHPDQFQPAPGIGSEAASSVFNDVCHRSFMVKMMVHDPTKTAAMTGQAAPIDFGPMVREKADALVAALPEEF